MKIKDYIINNFKDSSIDEIRNTLDCSIKEQDEMTLPGLGVFMDLIWENSNDNEKNNILNTLKKSL